MSFFDRTANSVPVIHSEGVREPQSSSFSIDCTAVFFHCLPVCFLTNLQSNIWFTTSTVSLLLNGFSDRLLNCLVLVFIKTSWFLGKVVKLPRALSRIQPNMALRKSGSKNVPHSIRELKIQKKLKIKAFNSISVLKIKKKDQNFKNKCK